jgi:hypothetical protein
MNVPEFDECIGAIDAGTANPLQVFVYENDVAGPASFKFRKELADLVRHIEAECLKAHLETVPGMLFEAIKHGDEKHQEWLRKAIDDFYLKVAK